MHTGVGDGCKLGGWQPESLDKHAGLGLGLGWRRAQREPRGPPRLYLRPLTPERYAEPNGGDRSAEG